MHLVNCKKILSPKNGMNIYRGCAHGCIYCDSRSTIYGMNHAFEDIEVKINAPDLLKKELASKRRKGMIGFGAMSDPYIPLEKDLKLTRKCLELILEHEFGVTILTKSDLVLRDLDLFKEINDVTKCVVQMTLTTADDNLCKIVEPNVCPTSRRAEVLKILNDNGIPTVVWFTPILPYINDTKENVNGILDYCIDSKVKAVIFFGAGLTLREGDREYYYKNLDTHFPGLKEKYIKQYGNSYVLPCQNYKELEKIFYTRCRDNGIICNNDEIFEYLYRYEYNSNQLSLFDSDF